MASAKGSKNPRPVRNRLIVRISLGDTKTSGGMWVGIAGSRIGEKAFTATQKLVCPVHRQRAKLELPKIQGGKWTVDAQTCCPEFFATLRKALIRRQ
jgi:hypothetical protein